MKHISIIVPNGNCILSSIIAAYKIFHNVNHYIQSVFANTNKIYEIDLVGLNNQTTLYDGAFQINPTQNVGYSDNKAFRKIFRKFTGLTPHDYRTKYNRDKVVL